MNVDGKKFEGEFKNNRMNGKGVKFINLEIIKNIFLTINN